MKLTRSHSRGRRQNTRGFTLLEVLLAFAVLSLSIAGLYSISARSSAITFAANQELELAQLARSVLDEYIITYPKLSISGVYKGTWRWSIKEQPHEPLEANVQNEAFSYFLVTATVWPEASPTNTYELKTVVARRAAK